MTVVPTVELTETEQRNARELAPLDEGLYDGSVRLDELAQRLEQRDEELATEEAAGLLQLRLKIAKRLAKVHLYRNDHARAGQILERAKQLLAGHGVVDPGAPEERFSAELDWLLACSYYQRSTSRMDVAAQFLARAHRLCQQAPLLPSRLDLLNLTLETGNLCRYQGRFARSAAILSGAVHELERVLVHDKQAEDREKLRVKAAALWHYHASNPFELLELIHGPDRLYTRFLEPLRAIASQCFSGETDDDRLPRYFLVYLHKHQAVLEAFRGDEDAAAGSIEEARELLDQAFPDHGRARSLTLISRAMTELLRHDFSAALSTLDEAEGLFGATASLGRSRTELRILFDRGRAFLGLRDYDAAKACLDEVVERSHCPVGGNAVLSARAGQLLAVARRRSPDASPRIEEEIEGVLAHLCGRTLSGISRGSTADEDEVCRKTYIAHLSLASSDRECQAPPASHPPAVSFEAVAARLAEEVRARGLRGFESSPLVSDGRLTWRLGCLGAVDQGSPLHSFDLDLGPTGEPLTQGRVEAAAEELATRLRRLTAKEQPARGA